MRLLATVFLVCAVAGTARAETYTLTTESEGVVSTSTIAMPSVATVDWQSTVNALLSQLSGGGDTLSQLQDAFSVLAGEVSGIVASGTADAAQLDSVVSRLGTLALRVQRYLLQQQLRDLPIQSGGGDTWFINHLFDVSDSIINQ